MPDLLEVFREKADSLLSSINSQGGIRSTIDSLRRQMEAADRRRAMSKAKSELKRLNEQVTEMITAVGVQAVGLHQAGKLNSIELRPLCQHIVELKQEVTRLESELAKMEAEVAQETAAAAVGKCPHCGQSVSDNSSFCPYCGQRIEKPQERFCAACGSSLRPGSKFCARCGRPTSTPG
ncbi:MAG: zinc-ribbon domain-containing protein [Chloroflexi bacterium]|jgi:DNA repair exonuclease SbcCD ATPase subunit|nr:zinc-ribbon domain-containing protein [Chloroflexota bacterium]